MMRRSLLSILIISMGILWSGNALLFARPHRVLVVMSYEESYAWTKAVEKGIRARLDAHAELRFFYLDTKRDYAGGGANAKAAMALFRQFKPHAVIAVDDNAQSFFVVPYLRNKVDTPVFFCGVNAAPAAYGYPAENVTGVLERLPIREAITFTQMLLPETRTVGFLTRAGATSQGILVQIESERDTYPANSLPAALASTLPEAQSQVEQLRQRCDVLYITNVNGLLDETGVPLTEEQIVPRLVTHFGKAIITSRRLYVQLGALLTVTNSGAEQGDLAARMLLKHLGGTPLKALPMRRNRQGERIVNLERMQALGITPLPAALVGVTFFKTP